MTIRQSLTSLGVTESAALIRSKEISPVELVTAFLEQIDTLEGRYNTFITLTADLALREARQAEIDQMCGETRAGHTLGLIHGVPLALKDLFETKDIRTTAGSKIFQNWVPKKDAAVVQRLRQEGGIILGKTNMHEIALGLTSVNPHFGAVHNPWATERIAGGSSGGSAAAVAARMAPAAMGTDTGGSIRVPATLCGITGLKPTFGRVSLRGVLPLSWNLDHVGPLAARVEDLALLLKIVAGFDPLDAYSVDIPVEDYPAHLAGDVAGWRIALAEDAYFSKTDSEVKQIVATAAEEFTRLDAHVEQVAFPFAFEAAQANGKMVIADAAALYAEELANRPEDFGEDVRRRLENGASLPLLDYIQARRTQKMLRREFQRFFEKFDLLLMPTTPIAAPSIEGPDAIKLAGLLTRYTAPFNLTGLPALSLPCGFTMQGLPVGLQIIGPQWGETRLLRAAKAYQEVTSWHLFEPPM